MKLCSCKRSALAAALLGLALAAPAHAQGKKYENIFDGYTKVVSTADGKPPMYEVWVDNKNGEMLAQLPKDFEKKKYFFAMTVASGERYAGLQQGDIYVYWKKYGDRLALIQPELETRSTGDDESKSSVKRLFTGKVLVDIPILSTSKKGEPVIDLDDLLLKHVPAFFGVSVNGSDMVRMLRLRDVKVAKAFPENVEIAFEVPVHGGRLKTFHYSISLLPESNGYAPRKADDRIGYFTTAYNDLGKFKRGETRTRYINRWRLEKADPSLNLSPPKNPIVFYIEHTTPIRYRRFVRDGVLYWNKAFEKIGLVDAIEVHYQDAATRAHMEKDPEDVRYNFIRWLNNDISTAIGPSRVHPRTGEILDADIILTDGWIRHFEQSFSKLLPQLAMEGFSPETMAWLERNPRWDPRIALAPSQERNRILAELTQKGYQPLGGHAFGKSTSPLLGDDEFDGLSGRVSQVNGMCMAAAGKAFDVTLLRMTHALMALDNPQGQNAAGNDEILDGIPARFIGPLLADLVAHEVGHTLGLRHNFKASSVYSLDQINSDAVKGKKPFATSVMDYLPINIRMGEGKVQGDYAMIGIGDYDFWAIEYGYTFDDKALPKILERSSEPQLQYGTDQDTIGPDPFARRYDFSSDPVQYAKNQMKIAEYHRNRLLDKAVKDGDSWAEARRGYLMTLSLQMRSLSMTANWIGGALIHRDHKGTKGSKIPVQPVDAERQRAALKWTIDNGLSDNAFGLTPEVLRHLRSDFLTSDESFSRLEDPAFPVHERVAGIQSSVLTMIMNPTTLRRIYDNEMMLEANKDALTLPELLKTLESSVWSELKAKGNAKGKEKYSNRQPRISSLRRNLQREYIERLIDLMAPSSGNPAATRPISTLAMLHLRELSSQVAATLKAQSNSMDRYTLAHLNDAQMRMTKALDAQHIFNAHDIGGRGPVRIFLSQPQTRCNTPGCSHCTPAPSTGSWDSRQ